MAAAPTQFPAIVAGAEACECLGQTVAIGLSPSEILIAVGGQFVGLIKDYEVVRLDFRLLQSSKQLFARQRVHADDQKIALRSVCGEKRVGLFRGGAGDDVERQAEEGVHLALPVPDQAGGRDDQNTPYQPSREHLAAVAASHNRFAGPSAVT